MVAFGPEWDVSISLSLQVSGNAVEEEAEEEEPAATEGTEDTSEPCACELTEAACTGSQQGCTR